MNSVGVSPVVWLMKCVGICFPCERVADDLLVGGPGADTIFGGCGNDGIYGGVGGSSSSQSFH